MNVRLTLSYVGTRFAGWQRQPNALAVQQVLEEALTDLTGAPVRTAGAGRTDAGVHAEGQVASCRLERSFPLTALVHGTNHRLPDDIRVLDAVEVSPGFHARRSAAAKLYRYRVHRGRPAAPERAPFVLAETRELDPGALAAAARMLPGEHDFEAFSVAGGTPGPSRRRIFAATWEEQGDELVFRIVGEGFLRGMVRRLAGTLLEIGAGRRPLAGLARLLDAGSESDAGPTAPAHGLCLVRVDYGPDSGPGLR